MRDLLLLSQDFPPDVGGTQTYSVEIARRWSEVCRVRVIAPRRPGDAAVDDALPFEVIRVGGGHNGFALRAAPAVRRAISEGFTRVFCVQWTAALAALVGGAGRAGLEVHTAAHGRELLFDPLPWPLSVLYSAVRRTVLRSVKGTYPVSRFTEDLLLQAGVPPGNIHVVPNGTDPNRFRPGDRYRSQRAWGLGHGPTVLTVCRLVARKGVDVLLRALPILADRVPGVRLLVAGDGPERAALERLAVELGVDGDVRFLGTVAPDDLPTLFTAADVFALVPRESRPDVEGFGLVYLEAGACGLPVVGSRTGGIPDAVLDGVTGLLVPPDDPEAVASALHFLLADQAVARSMGEAGRDHVLRTGNWARAAERIAGCLGGD